MLADDVYDAFFLIPLYLGMYYKADLNIHGYMSKKLYKNSMNYLQQILCDFSDDLSRIDVKADGFKEAEGEQNIIGSSFSCGVDSLSTIYDRYALENDPDYRINGLFLFNVGWHGDYYDAKSEELFFKRYELNKPATDELGLHVYLVKTNFHAFAYHLYADNHPGSHMGYFACYSCVFGLGRAVKRYYMSSGHSYEEIKMFGEQSHDEEMSSFADSYLVPLVHTERTEIIIDGCQYERSQKTERLQDWNIAHKYLNVCVVKSDAISDAHNCSKCSKCMRTLIALEALGRLKEFSGVFNLEVYAENSYKNKCDIVLRRQNDGFKADNYNFALAHGLKLPSYFTAFIVLLPSRAYRLCRRTARRLFGEKFCRSLKNFLKR